jgi:hypothetical protein
MPSYYSSASTDIFVRFQPRLFNSQDGGFNEAHLKFGYSSYEAKLLYLEGLKKKVK